jgi:hypothetical protein
MDRYLASYCLSHNWVLGANDPGLIGWLTVIAYLATAALCYATGRIVSKAYACDRRPEQVFWFGLALALMALGFNKQLDLQTPFIGMSKHLAMAEGVYRERRVIQWGFIVFLAALGGSVLAWTCWKLRHRWRDYWLAYGGILLLCGFVLLQASPIHRLDRLPWTKAPAVSGRHIMELAGIGCIGFAGLISLRKARLSNSSTQGALHSR